MVFPEVYPRAAAPAIEIESWVSIMRLRGVLRAAALSFVLACGGISMGCAKARHASSAEEAVHLLEAATRDGNFDQRLALTPKRERERVVKVRDLLKHLKQASAAFDAAMDARFGPDPLHQRKQAHDFSAAFDSADDNARIEVVSQEKGDDDAVRLKLKMTRTNNEKTGTTKTTEVSCVAIKEEDGWKLKMGSDEAATSSDETLIAALNRQIQAFEQAAADVKAGKYLTRADALNGLFSPAAGSPEQPSK